MAGSPAGTGRIPGSPILMVLSGRLGDTSLDDEVITVSDYSISTK
jgi:hypothetical protein